MSHAAPPPRRTWPWIVAVVVAVVAIITAVSLTSLLFGPDGAPHAGSTTPGADATGSSEAASPPTGTANAPAASPGSTTSGPSGMSSSPSSPSSASRSSIEDEDVTRIEAAIESGAYADLYGYLADPVHVTIAASDFDSDRSPDQAVVDLEYLQGSGEWEWDVDSADLKAFRDGPYADAFPPGAIVGESSEGFVVALTPEGPWISSILLSRNTEVLVP